LMIFAKYCKKSVQIKDFQRISLSRAHVNLLSKFSSVM
jgi:hypothetical protein